MHFIKLDAIGSTNDFLKDLAKQHAIENFTIVTAESQTSGRGQRGAVWQSEPGKNLTMSLFLRFYDREAEQLFVLNVITGLVIAQVLKDLQIPAITLKWPNDIMSGNKKVGGILIENNVKTATNFESVIGIGLNVNQVDFEGLPSAGSLYTQTLREHDKDQIAVQIAEALKSRVASMQENANQIWEEYNANLFRKGQPTVFEDQSGNQFMGIISTASRDGRIGILLEDDSVKFFGIKDVTMRY